MNAPASLKRPRAVGVAAVSSIEELAAIREPGCAAVIWNRASPDAMTEWLAGLTPDHMPDGRLALRPGQVRGAVDALLSAAGAPSGEGREMFADDVAKIARAFAETAGAAYLRLRLQTVTNNACRKYHLDVVEQRLVCTYRGPGTQYGVAEGEEDPREVFETPEGAPILLRGELWRGDAPSGLKHRSPPIEGTGVARLVLVLDPLDELIDEGMDG
ncbi:MAG: DUF1826 domain-containing protein [Pseudomonadota bacterium]